MSPSAVREMVIGVLFSEDTFPLVLKLRHSGSTSQRGLNLGPK